MHAAFGQSADRNACMRSGPSSQASRCRCCKCHQACCSSGACGCCSDACCHSRCPSCKRHKGCCRNTACCVPDQCHRGPSDSCCSKAGGSSPGCHPSNSCPCCCQTSSCGSGKCVCSSSCCHCRPGCQCQCTCTECWRAIRYAALITCRLNIQKYYAVCLPEYQT